MGERGDALILVIVFLLGDVIFYPRPWLILVGDRALGAFPLSMAAAMELGRRKKEKHLGHASLGPVFYCVRFFGFGPARNNHMARYQGFERGTWRSDAGCVAFLFHLGRGLNFPFLGMSELTSRFARSRSTTT